MNAGIWPPEKYRTEIWENNNTTWTIGKLYPAGSQPKNGDTIVLFYTGRDRGIYGWAVILRYEEKEVYFRPATPSDYLKMNPLWDDDVKNIIDEIRPMPRGNMWEINDTLMNRIREKINQYI
jgi:hypothetical protein